MEHFKQGSWIRRLEFRKEFSRCYVEKGVEEMCEKKSKEQQDILWEAAVVQGRERGVTVKMERSTQIEGYSGGNTVRIQI